MDNPGRQPAQYARDLRKKAAQIREEAASHARQLLDSARAQGSKILALAEEHAQSLEQAAVVYEAEASDGNVSLLQARLQHESVHSMKDTHRLAIAAAHSSSPLAVASREAGYSIRQLAKLPTVEANETTLRDGHSGKRPIPESVCKRVQVALGRNKAGAWRFPATTENWPRMISGQ